MHRRVNSNIKYNNEIDSGNNSHNEQKLVDVKSDKSLNKNINSKSANNLRIVEHFNEIFNKNKLFHSYIRNHKEIIHDSEKDYQINKLQEIQNRSIRKENHLNDNLIKIHYLLKMNDKNDLLKKPITGSSKFESDDNGSNNLSIKKTIKNSLSSSSIMIPPLSENAKLISVKVKNPFVNIPEFQEYNEGISFDDNKTQDFNNYNNMNKINESVESDEFFPNQIKDSEKKELNKKLLIIRKSDNKSLVKNNSDPSTVTPQKIIKYKLADINKIINIKTVTKDTRTLSLDQCNNANVKLPVISIFEKKKIQKDKVKEGFVTRIRFMNGERQKLLDNIYIPKLNFKQNDELPIIKNK